jgi:hypothetical protein
VGRKRSPGPDAAPPVRLRHPKVLGGAFHQRHRLRDLCHIVGCLLTQAYREADPDGQPGLILLVQTFGEPVIFHPHMHTLVTDSAFHPNGVFRPGADIGMTRIRGSANPY